jgi:hypothetical protein
MANELHSLSVLFQNRLFRIPDYQRGYAWKREQLADFWDDLMNLQEDRYHYTGLLSLKPSARISIKSWHNDEWLIDSGFKPFYVVDGQQRLTTFSILLFELVSFMKMLPDNKEKSDEDIFVGFESLRDIKAKYILRRRPPQNLITTYLFGYETDNPSADYLKYKVFEEPYGGTVFETYYTRNLKFAKDFFAQSIDMLYQSEGTSGIESLYRKLTLHLMFNLHEIEDDYDVFVAFETMNNRGKRLTNLELLKNRLIYLTTLFDDDQLDKRDKEQLRHDINGAWKEVYYQLGRNQSTPLSDDEFLRHHWIMYFTYSRKKGDDYIKFLLSKFSAKNVFEKVTVTSPDEPDVSVATDDIGSDDDDDLITAIEQEIIVKSKLQPHEISKYVRSLKETAEFWYYSFFPEESSTLTSDEKLWIDRLNRIGIGYFRPLVTASIMPKANATSEERVAFFAAIERFIFTCFRLASFQSSYASNVYYAKAKSICEGEITLQSVTDELNGLSDDNSKEAVLNFLARNNRRFNSGDGFYAWRDLKYLLFEYEFSLGQQSKLQKVDWRLFSAVEKDKFSIEHIFPQTPTVWYWRNQFRQFSDTEKRALAGSLGNLLPLSQSINSSLQNDCFNDKKRSKPGRRGYENGSHSEIEVSKEVDWDAQHIFDRGMRLLSFIETRWKLSFGSDDQKIQILHLDFLADKREIPPEIPKPTSSPKGKFFLETDDESTNEYDSDLHEQQLVFWSSFIEYCKNRDHIYLVTRKPLRQNYYDVPINASDYQLLFTITRGHTARIIIYTYNLDAFKRLEQKKDAIELICSFHLDWYSSRSNSVQKRIIYSREIDYYDAEKQIECFDWFIECFDTLKAALDICDPR